MIGKGKHACWIVRTIRSSLLFDDHVQRLPIQRVAWRYFIYDRVGRIPVDLLHASRRSRGVIGITAIACGYEMVAIVSAFVVIASLKETGWYCDRRISMDQGD